MNYKKFQGKRIEEVANHRKDLSCYCMNYYEDSEGNIILADSDSEDQTEYCLVIFDGERQHFHEPFAESYTSDNNIINVFPKFM